MVNDTDVTGLDQCNIDRGWANVVSFEMRMKNTHNPFAVTFRDVSEVDSIRIFRMWMAVRYELERKDFRNPVDHAAIKNRALLNWNRVIHCVDHPPQSGACDLKIHSFHQSKENTHPLIGSGCFLGASAKNYRVV